MADIDMSDATAGADQDGLGEVVPERQRIRVVRQNFLSPIDLQSLTSNSYLDLQIRRHPSNLREKITLWAMLYDM